MKLFSPPSCLLPFRWLRLCVRSRYVHSGSAGRRQIGKLRLIDIGTPKEWRETGINKMGSPTNSSFPDNCRRMHFIGHVRGHKTG